MTKRYDIEGCTGHCYGGYRMAESADGEYVHVDDFQAIEQQRDLLFAVLDVSTLDGAAKEIARLHAMSIDLEREQIRLAACGVAALANTPESAKSKRIYPNSQYWSASYSDVCDAVDREIALREQRNTLLEALKTTASNIRWRAAAGNHRTFDAWLQTVEAAIALCEVKS